MIEESFRYAIKDIKKKIFFKILIIKLWIYIKQTILKLNEIPYLEMMVTTNCNLRCKGCSNLIPHTIKEDISYKEIKEDIDILLNKINYLYRLKIHGGEVFLHREFKEIIDFLGKQKKIGSIRIATNGTIIPTEEILKAMKKNNIVVQISDYKINSATIEKLKKNLKENDIEYKYLKDREWNDMGSFQRRSFNRKKLCSLKRCTSFYKGRIYICSRAMIMKKIGYIKETNSLIIRDKNFRSELKRFFELDNEACNYCDGDTEYSKIIQPGIQE